MKSNRYFIIENSLIDREDLSIYEKMCVITLARYAGQEAFGNMLSLGVIATKMGCDISHVKKAFENLVKKGLVYSEEKNVIKSQDSKESIRPLKFDNFEDFTPSEQLTESTSDQSNQTSEKTSCSNANVSNKTNIRKKRTDKSNLIKSVKTIIKEQVTDMEAKIILNLANNDIELIRQKYKIVSFSQFSDKVDALVRELQKKEVPKDVNVNKQIDLRKINKYKSMKKN